MKYIIYNCSIYGEITEYRTYSTLKTAQKYLDVLFQHYNRMYDYKAFYTTPFKNKLDVYKNGKLYLALFITTKDEDKDKQ